MTFLYKLPFPPDGTSWQYDCGNTLATLHTLITKVDKKTKRAFKPPLADRHSIANSLALTVLNIHCSALIHKNIWSHGILLFLQDNNGSVYPLGATTEIPDFTPIAATKKTLGGGPLRNRSLAHRLLDLRPADSRDSAETKLLKAKDVTATLTGLAKRELPKEKGERFASAVMACLGFHKERE
ncbi:uncharacterized protein TrAtP1_004982 [Trichoderma atroviride]|uniref:uncharacterized protein n=1 Tax=Hypocrea atroviridis TaxID=63577 RepID=UPI00331FDF8B|nr:hypothetical protein TrAtP1_004982 [Trichoderma atroviride]